MVAAKPAQPMARSLAHDLAGVLDPMIFARRAGITPDPRQADVPRSNHRSVCWHTDIGRAESSSVGASSQYNQEV